MLTHIYKEVLPSNIAKHKEEGHLIQAIGLFNLFYNIEKEIEYKKQQRNKLFGRRDGGYQLPNTRRDFK